MVAYSKDDLFFDTEYDYKVLVSCSLTESLIVIALDP